MKHFVLAFALFSFTQLAQAQQYSSATSCAAYTACYDNYGNAIGTISCTVFGYQTVQSYGASASNSCTWFVQPYVSVQCSGYEQVYDAYTGTYQWLWQNYSYRCPGR